MKEGSILAQNIPATKHIPAMKILFTGGKPYETRKVDNTAITGPKIYAIKKEDKGTY